MSNNGVSQNYSPSFTPGVHDYSTAESVGTTDPLSGWDNVVAAVRLAKKKRQELLLTLTADNMTPIWLDLRTNRYFSETSLDDLPDETVNPKLYARLIDSKKPLFPWVSWRSIDAALWAIGGKAFHGKGARWLVRGDRYSLVRWPNLTQIPYDSDELNAISMLANGLLTVDELALIAHIPVEESQQLISTLSFMGVLSSNEAPGSSLAAADTVTALPPITHEDELAEASLIMDKETHDVLADADRFRQQIDRPLISSISLPELPEEVFYHHYDEDAQKPTEDSPKANAEAPREQQADRFYSAPSFESILEAQNIESAALDSVTEDAKPAPKEKSRGLFSLLKLKLGKK